MLTLFQIGHAVCSQAEPGPEVEPEPFNPEEPTPEEPAPNSPEINPGCPECFAADTPIHTDNGDVPMEKIAVGDRVLARDSQSGKLELEPVTALVPRHPGKLLNLQIEGEPSPLRPSFGHPF